MPQQQQNRLNDISFSQESMPGSSGAPLPTDVDDLSMRKQIHIRYKQDTDFRKYFSVWVMIIAPVWLVATLVIVILCGCSVLVLPQSVINTLLATTTATVLGLAYIVLKGMFPEGVK